MMAYTDIQEFVVYLTELMTDRSLIADAGSKRFHFTVKALTSGTICSFSLLIHVRIC